MSGVALATCPPTLVVLNLRAQGLGEGDEHPPAYTLLVEYGELYLFYICWLSGLPSKAFGDVDWVPTLNIAGRSSADSGMY